MATFYFDSKDLKKRGLATSRTLPWSKATLQTLMVGLDEIQNNTIRNLMYIFITTIILSAKAVYFAKTKPKKCMVKKPLSKT